MKQRLLYLSSTAVPHQIQLCNALQSFYDAEFWFYEGPERARGSFWKVDLGPHCRILDKVFLARDGWLADRYIASGLNAKIRAFNPDILILGGFSIPSNILSYLWAKRNCRKTVVFTERSRTPAGELRQLDVIWRMLRWIYRDVDLVVTCADDVVPQFRDAFGFGGKVVSGRYATDLDNYFKHSTRGRKPGYTFLFANRMTRIYGPEIAITVFADVLKRYPESRLLMNAAGELADECSSLVDSIGVGHAVEWLTGIKRWEELNLVYERSDILLLPASFSNGNATILEAMASGMGIVVSDKVLGSGSLIVDGKNGFNCEPTGAAFCARIDRYIENPELFSIHAHQNRKIVEPLGAVDTARDMAQILRTNL